MIVGTSQPVNASPSNGATAVSLAPTLQASAFADADGDKHVASRWQVRNSAGNYDTPVYDSGSTTSLTSVGVPSGELDYSTTYFWRVGYQDSRGAWSAYSAETSFTTIDPVSTPPTVVTGAATEIGSTSARLNLNLTSPGSVPSVQVSFEWGQGTAYGNTTTAETLTGIGSYSFLLSGLAPDTTYHFRAKAMGSDTAYGSDMAFTTGTAPAGPPASALAVTTGSADGITANSAQLHGELTSVGTVDSVTVSFIWGSTPGGPFPNETSSATQTGNGCFSFNLTGLSSTTTYYYQAKAVGDGTCYGAEKSFTTTGGGPVVGTLIANSGRQGDRLTVTITGANLAGATTVAFGAGITISEFRVVSDSEITAKIVIDERAEPGKRDITVTTPQGTGTAPAGFTVNGTSGQMHLWVYLVVVAGAVMALGILATLGVWVKRRLAK